MGSFKRFTSNGKRKKHSSSKLVEKSRKQLRKEVRKQKKINRAIYFQNKSEFNVSRTRDDENLKTRTIDENENSDDHTTDKTIDLQQKSIRKRKQQNLERRKNNKKKELLKEENLKEDKIIKKLEKQLKLNKRKKKSIPKSFVADGLDYILNFCLEDDRKCMVETEREKLENEINNDFEEDLTMAVEGTPIENTQVDNELYECNENENTSNSSASIIEDNLSDSSDLEINKVDDESVDTNVKDEDLWEDIYGRKRDKDGNVINEIKRYLPPAARINVDSVNMDSQKLHTLKKQLKGCLNRVAEHNIHTIANQIEEMYMAHSRYDMNHMLLNLTFEALVGRILTPDRLICEHMMLIAILHANVGVEVGAHFLEKLVKKFVETMEATQDVENKELDNVILMIAHLYNFKVYGHKLLYQILNKLMIKFTEKEIELILLILKTVGFPLRKDDPIALKEFIQNLQQKASQGTGESSRVKYMLDVLLAIKNNNVNKIPQYDPSHAEHLKKIIKSVIRKGNTVTQFNVSLEDLLRADENGKWWIIGSAWSGSNTVNDQERTKEKNTLNFGKKILELAQKQRMNTYTRKNIFCILMTAEDYLDAFEKLHHLGLKDQQGEEIINVLMHCCLQENKFNPYYAVLAQKLCEYNRKYQLTIQYALWDKLKTLGTYGSRQLNNLARFFAYLFIEKCLPLSILKVIEFTELDKQTMKFVRQTILGILLHKNEQACLDVFNKISVSPQLQTFRESLRLFINCFLIKNIDSTGMMDDKEIMLKRRAELIDKILISEGSKVIF
ncbi:nucleolar MIF4G domain-containing protein 1 homolog [Hylaeus anthracinus]|uniref:nucleolar MIF4G domain-containing protein 1 homolog n=1 Tax=Hylaeus anthracinus TaxID=313031 RepID=UPI0023B91ED5|nr:nucleolar MIF4G domain-containing protein 1 homolog [Hylaeus anthracinus]